MLLSPRREFQHAVPSACELASIRFQCCSWAVRLPISLLGSGFTKCATPTLRSICCDALCRLLHVRGGSEGHWAKAFPSLLPGFLNRLSHSSSTTSTRAQEEDSSATEEYHCEDMSSDVHSDHQDGDVSVSSELSQYSDGFELQAVTFIPVSFV